MGNFNLLLPSEIFNPFRDFQYASQSQILLWMILYVVNATQSTQKMHNLAFVCSIFSWYNYVTIIRFKLSDGVTIINSMGSLSWFFICFSCDASIWVFKVTLHAWERQRSLRKSWAKAYFIPSKGPWIEGLKKSSEKHDETQLGANNFLAVKASPTFYQRSLATWLEQLVQTLCDCKMKSFSHN